MSHRQYGGNLSGGIASLESATWLNRRPAARGSRSPNRSAMALNPGCLTVASNVPGSSAGATGITARPRTVPRMHSNAPRTHRGRAVPNGVVSVPSLLRQVPVPAVARVLSRQGSPARPRCCPDPLPSRRPRSSASVRHCRAACIDAAGGIPVADHSSDRGRTMRPFPGRTTLQWTRARAGNEWLPQAEILCRRTVGCLRCRNRAAP